MTVICIAEHDNAGRRILLVPLSLEQRSFAGGGASLGPDDDFRRLICQLADRSGAVIDVRLY